MDLKKQQRIVIDALEDIKGQDIRVYDTQQITDLFDRVVIVSGTSNRQTRAMASHVRDKVKSAGGDVISVEGEESGEWVLVDLGDIVVHVMQPAIRAYYNLEELWGAKPVRVKLGAASGLAKAQSDDEPDSPAPVRAAPARTRAAKAAAETPAEDTAKPKARAPRAGAGAKAGASKAGAVKAGASKAGASKAGVSKTGATKTSASKSGASKAGASKAGASKAGADTAGAPKPRVARPRSTPRAS